MKNSLYIVATPIGNLDDITIRAIDTLKIVDVILAEDTRHSKRLLNHYHINTKVQALHEYNERQNVPNIIDKLLVGQNIALISDAGTPLISDPGYILVSEAQKAGIQISPIPGPSALISAISASGIACNRFSFFGFFPTGQSARLKTIQRIKNLNETAIFYESPKRILACAEDLETILGSTRIVCIAKELTKSFETIKTDVLTNLIQYLQADKQHQKGEFVVLINAIRKNDHVLDETKLDNILPILLTEMSTAKAAKLSAKITGINKKHCYQKALILSQLT